MTAARRLALLAGAVLALATAPVVRSVSAQVLHTQDDPRDARVHLRAARAAFLDRRDPDARAEAERALALDPKLTEARILLGQAQHRMGDLAGAIASYEIVVAERPGDEAARSTLARWRREQDLEARMQHAVGAHFTVSFEGPEEQPLADAALARLDEAYLRIGGVLGVYPADPIPVVLYTTEEFRDVTRSPDWAAGAYDGTIRVPMRGALQNPSELDRVLSHEFAHAVVRTLAARPVPTWLNEGLATALEAGDLGWAEARVRRGPGRVSLRTLQNGFARFSGSDAELAYATSALAVRRLLDEAGGFALANLLRDAGEGVDFDAAFLHRIGRPFDDFDRGLR